MSATILFNSLSWWAPALLLGILAAGVAFWGYRSSRLSGHWRWICVGLKTLSILALALCLLEPLWVTQRAKTGANTIVLLADNSLSLQIHDQNSSRSRGEVLKEQLTSASALAWQDTLSKEFQVRRYSFDSRPQRLESFSDLTFDGRSSALHSALRGLRERFAGQPLAGIVLFSDGNITDVTGPGFDLRQVPPIFPVVAGQDRPARDVSVTAVAATQTAFEDAPVHANVDVTAFGCAGESIAAQVLDLSGKVVAEQTEIASGDEARMAFRFQIRPESSGLSYYTVRVAAGSDLPRLAAGGEVREATLTNNARMFVVDRGQEPYRVLYISGRPNWEFKFLNRAIQEDPQVQMVALIRVARREPKFAFRGRAGESSNPLFRGFGNQNTEEVESYDQPVLVRFNTRDQEELRGGFPKTAEELFSYHALILDDLEAGFFNPAQMQLIQRFVSQRGGGLLMLGGKDSFQSGQYARTSIGDLLPVYLDSVPAGLPATNNLQLTFTREGMLQPWLRLRTQEDEERDRLKQLPGFQVLNRVRDFKPGAMVLATVQDDRGGTHPAIAAQRFGNGRSAAILIGDVWRWGMQSPEHRKDMEKSWRQMVRWLVSDVPTRVELAAEPIPGDPNQAVTLQVRTRDKAFQPIDNARAIIEIIPKSLGLTNPVPSVQLEAEASPTEPGLYQTVFVPRLQGAYEARVVVTSAQGTEEGSIRSGWTSESGSQEFQSLKPNREALEDLARSTGGELLKGGDLMAFARSLPSRNLPVMETAATPLWHRSAVFLLALACFIAEWGIRRWRGLA